MDRSLKSCVWGAVVSKTAPVLHKSIRTQLVVVRVAIAIVYLFGARYIHHMQFGLCQMIFDRD